MSQETEKLFADLGLPTDMRLAVRQFAAKKSTECLGLQSDLDEDTEVARST